MRPRGAAGGAAGSTRLSILGGVRAEFTRADDPERVVGTAEWDGRRVAIESDEDATRASLRRVFRPSPVSLDDPSFRFGGTSGPAVVEHGDMEWFRAAALARAAAEGLEVAIIANRPGGWDPAMDPQTYGWAGRKTSLSGER